MEGTEALPAAREGFPELPRLASLQEPLGRFASTAWESSCCPSEESRTFTACTFGASTRRSRCCPCTWLRVGWCGRRRTAKRKACVWMKVSLFVSSGEEADAQTVLTHVTKLLHSEFSFSGVTVQVERWSSAAGGCLSLTFKCFLHIHSR